MDATTRVRVLCVDDNRDAADTTSDLFRIVGFESRACYDGPSALLAAREFEPQVCVIDLNMPGMDGDELAAHLREEAAGRPAMLVAVTAMDDYQSRSRTAAAGFDMHLVKPVDPHDLLRVVDELWRVLDRQPSEVLSSER